MRLRVLVGRLRFHHPAGLGIDVVVSLAGSVDAVGPVEAGVEPLRRVGRRHLHREHVAQLVEEGARALLRIEVAALPAPVRPGAGEAIEDLLRRVFGAVALALRQLFKRGLVGDRTPEPGGNPFLLHLLQPRGHARLTKILLRQHVGGDLGPEGRHLHRVRAEDHRAIRIADLARGYAEGNVRVGGLPVFRVAPLDPHGVTLCCCPPRARALPRLEGRRLSSLPPHRQWRRGIRCGRIKPAPRLPHALFDVLRRRTSIAGFSFGRGSRCGAEPLPPAAQSADALKSLSLSGRSGGNPRTTRAVRSEG
jgi:hypothetical protein